MEITKKGSTKMEPFFVRQKFRISGTGIYSTRNPSPNCAGHAYSLIPSPGEKG